MMNSTVALSSAGVSCSPTTTMGRPAAATSSAFPHVDISFNTSMTTMMMSKKSVPSSPYSYLSAAVSTVNNNNDNLSAVGRNCFSVGRRIIPRGAARSNNSGTPGPSISASSASTTISEREDAVEAEATKKIGARVRVTVPLKVYHVPRVPEMDLAGKEGHLKQYVGLWKEKRISANLPFKVEFVVDIEGRGPVKFFAHLKEDEFEYLD